MKETASSAIERRKSDWLAALAKGSVGAVPLVGPLIAEVIGQLIPNQRIDRLSRFVEILDQRLHRFETLNIEVLARNERVVDLLEDGFMAAARALSEDRLVRIASLIANGISREEMDCIGAKHLLKILSELNEIELVILQGYHDEFVHDAEFREKYDDVLYLDPPTWGSEAQEIERYAISKGYRIHLTRLGLLKPKFAKPKRGAFPDLDLETGMIKSSGYKLTRLGRVLLARTDLVKSEEIE